MQRRQVLRAAAGLGLALGTGAWAGAPAGALGRGLGASAGTARMPAADGYLTYARLQAVLAAWRDLGVAVHVPARSVQGRDLACVVLGRGPVTLLYTNMLHANEPSGAEAFVRFVWALLGHGEHSFDMPLLDGITADSPVHAALADQAVRRELLRRVRIVGFPMLDPDGVEAGHVRNPATNADYLTQLTRQSQAITTAIDAYAPSLLVDTHGGPNAPDLNIGLVETNGVEQAVVASSRRAAAVCWRAAAAVGAGVAYFEEHPSSMVLGQHGQEPLASADEAYYASFARGVPLLQEANQLRGLPTVYTETVGLQSTRPSISIPEGASAQQVAMAGLALEAAGMVSGERPHTRVVPHPGGTTALDLPHGGRDLFVVVSWTAQHTTSTLRLLDDRRQQVAVSGEPGPTDPPWLRARALHVGELPPGRYTVLLERTGLPADRAVLQASWRTADPGGWALDGILDPGEARLCLSGDTAFRQAAGSTTATAPLAGPSCGRG